MQIILIKDLNPKKGWVAGASFDWPRPVITAIEEQMGDSAWYTFEAGLLQSLQRSQARDGRKAIIPGRAVLSDAPRGQRGRPKKQEEAEMVIAPEPASMAAALVEA